VPLGLVVELQQELHRSGLVPDVQATGHAPLRILGRFDAVGAPASAVSVSGLAKAMKRQLRLAAGGMPEEDAEQLRKASAHWLKNTHAANVAGQRRIT